MAGAALWALDYILFAGASGIKRMHFHEGIGFKYNMVSSPYFHFSMASSDYVTHLFLDSASDADALARR